MYAEWFAIPENPAGGPLVAYNQDGTTSLQIWESSQIDMSNPDAKEQFESGTHFNPVDLVCAWRDNKGEKYEFAEIRKIKIPVLFRLNRRMAES